MSTKTIPLDLDKIDLEITDSRITVNEIHTEIDTISFRLNELEIELRKQGEQLQSQQIITYTNHNIHKS